MTGASDSDGDPSTGAAGWRLLSSARERAGLSFGELYVRYVALGGSSSSAAVHEHCTAGDALSAGDGDLVVLALNERFLETDATERLPYSG